MHLVSQAWLQQGGYQCDKCFDPDIRVGYQHAKSSVVNMPRC